MTRLHVLGLSFSETTSEWNHCAFSARTTDFCTMMTEAGMEVLLYAGENNDAKVSEHVALTTREEQREWWPDYEPSRDVFNSFDPNEIGWRTFNRRAIAAIHERTEQGCGDILCCTMGLTHKPVADTLNGPIGCGTAPVNGPGYNGSNRGLLAVETGIGYSGVWAPFRVYESWAWRNYITGKYGPDDTHKSYDVVLPRAYNPDDFPLGKGDGGYYLFLGRLTERKGPHIAAMACERIGAKLIVAGQGEYPLPGDVEYRGTVGSEERAELMGGAIAVFCPSLYLEPFCGVSVEAQLTGCPVIAANWGGLVENVDEDSGFLCDTLADYANAAESAADYPQMMRRGIQERAQHRWSVDVLGPKYRAYFERLQTLPYPGWYA